ncbi:hypothetical protein nbrc107696_27000 [Gordonia spumicola]|uniref:MobA/VirD2-like nuclease domain-containing protein n=1 Tax=Gordonia spumicola TaxID=589161 RepID=A0A7I9VAI0_9ACTN|nr:relaxase/mobilization nuclease domain-containing protein [Gordonia spumicola]GEE02254.1 hypothetical protein nbrc107696_27000 [Gordonia spumicola]
MSGVNVRSSRSAQSSVDYALYGGTEQAEAGAPSRAAAMSSSLGSPAEFVARAEAHGRKIQAYSYTQNFHPDEFDVNNPDHVKRVNELGRMLAEDMHSADYLVVTHTDSKGGHLHNHIYVVNDDLLTGGSLQRNTSWRHGVWQTNDAVMLREGCRVQASPMEAKQTWSQRRETFKAGGFEQTLGDKVAAALRDPRSVDREHFEVVLAEHDVKLAITGRDGWSYKMRRADNGKLGRKKASGLAPDFTAENAHAVFDYHAQRAQTKESNRESLGRDEAAGPAAGSSGRDLGRVGVVDLTPGRGRVADRGADGSGEQVDRPTGADTSATHDDGADAAASAQRHLRVRTRAEKARRDREDTRSAGRDLGRRVAEDGNRGPAQRTEDLGYSR